MAILKNTTIQGTGYLTVPAGTTAQRSTVTPTVVTYTSGSGTWTVPAGVKSVEVLVVAGGGGGGPGYQAGGGGAGGVLYRSNYAVTPGESISYSVGAGGAGGSSTTSNNVNAKGANGNNSTFGTLTAIGGGGGGSYWNTNNYGFGLNGGSGGGAGATNTTELGGLGTDGQGNNGGGCVGYGAPYCGGGGGGAGGPGSLGGGNSLNGGGGPGLAFAISGTTTWYGGGGGGGTYDSSGAGCAGLGGIGGGGNGYDSNNGSNSNNSGVGGSAGTANTGGGGGGGGGNGNTGGAGGSGIVIIKYQLMSSTTEPYGMIRLNSETNVYETYTQLGWVSADAKKNYVAGGTDASGYRTHIYTSGTTTFTPSNTGTVEVLVVAGGGGGGGTTNDARIGGGGAGGVIYESEYLVTAGTSYTVTVGAGGAGGSTGRGANGSNSQFGTLVAIGGGGGGTGSTDTASLLPGNAGGSGGGGGASGSSTGRNYGGPGVPGQGFSGGTGEHRYGTDASGAGGGGAGGPGGSAGAINRSTVVNGFGGNGGPGIVSNIAGYLKAYAGGGAGGAHSTITHGAGIAGGGNYDVAGEANTGGGGGGRQAGGSGVVIVRYKTGAPIIQMDGSSSDRAAVSALSIKQLTGTTTDGLYWININGTATQVYCDMNTNGGGWMHCGTFADGGEATNNANHIWGAPLNSAQDAGIWQNTTTVGSQSFTADFKNSVWAYYPMTQMLMKDSGNTLRNLWYTHGISPQTLSQFWAGRRWMAEGSGSSYTNGEIQAGRVYFINIVNFGVNDPVFGSSSLDKILFKWGERDGVQDGNKDRAMISYQTTSGGDVDVPKGIGCFTNRSGTINYRDIVPSANGSDWPPDSITGTHYLTMWVR